MVDTNQRGRELAGAGLGARDQGASTGLPAEGDAQLHPAETRESSQKRSTDHTRGPG